MSKDEFDHVLKNLLGISRGDSVLVHCSFRNLKAEFSPREAVELLMDTVGQDGNILMPYYPEDSKNWLEQDKVFNVETTPTRSGILSATFASFPEVKKSLHPIKSIAVWGKDRDYLISTHHESVTPFDEKSPTSKLIGFKNAKSIGLGIFKYLLMHSAEDIIQTHPKYYSQPFNGKVVDYSGNKLIVKTPYHKKTKLVPAGEYLHLTKCPGYEEIFFKRRRFYVSDASMFIEHLIKMANQNKTALDIKTPIARWLISKINRA